MSELFQIGAGVNGSCRGLAPIVKLIKNGLFPIIQIGIPIVLIALGTVDLGKAVIASNEEAIKKAQSMLVKRAIYAVAIFFVATIVTVLMGVVAKGAGTKTTSSWANCWDRPS